MSGGSIGGMIDAAAAARKASHSGVDVEIVVTEEGFVVRGRLELRTEYRHKSRDLSFADFILLPHLLLNSVGLVLTDLADILRKELEWDEAAGAA